MDDLTPNLLVLGGTGFIGKNICMRALSFGWSVDSFSIKPIKKNDSNLLKNVNYINGDLILNKENCRSKLSKYDYIVNASGYVDHTLFFEGGEKNVENHFLLVLNLIQIINKSKLKKFIQIGSSDEYGSSKAPQTEELRENPISSYSLGKVSTTHFLQMLFKTEKFPSVILRVFLTYGPGQKNNRFIPQIIEGCKNNLSFPTSEGMQIRDFCFIDDVVDAIFLSFKKNNINGEIINIGSGIPTQIKDLIEEIRNIIGKGTPLYGEYPYRNSENMELYSNSSKSYQFLGWKPKTPLKMGLKKTIDWYLQNGKTVS